MDYRDRVAIVTGASSGIGRCIAVDLAARGARVVLAARRAVELEETARECSARRGAAGAAAGDGVHVVPGDLAEPAFADALAAAALERFGRLDIVVNNAGIAKHKQIHLVAADELERVFRVNFLAAARLTLAALPALVASGDGFVINVSSVAGKLPPPRETIYAASKFALEGFTEGLWLDLAGSGVHAAVIHVGPIDTDIWRSTDEPSRYRGRRFPPSMVSRAVLRCIEERRHALWVPRRFALAYGFRLLLPGVYRWASARFDPVPRAVIEAARTRGRR
jgi:NAD(P)-dependent dehydrogenase (short-subunit alcohol dehydrogenase family)